jgi:hypothetical protein
MVARILILKVAGKEGNGEEIVDVVSDVLLTQMNNKMPIEPHDLECP